MCLNKKSYFAIYTIRFKQFICKFIFAKRFISISLKEKDLVYDGTVKLIKEKVLQKLLLNYILLEMYSNLFKIPVKKVLQKLCY